jgi:hypothetical protein
MSDIYYTYASREELLAVGADTEHIYEDIANNDHKLQQATLTEQQCHALIPSGGFCYTRKDGQFKHCPFLDFVETLPKQGNGFCHYIKRGDFTSPGTDLLWDSCKCCGINDNEEDYGPEH